MGAASQQHVEVKRKQKVKKVKPLLEPLSQDGEHEGNSAFARALGSVDFLTRERGVQALTRLLQRKTDITEGDMLKLWKGLYFCFWHSDKAPVQAELAERLAGILPSLSDPVAWLYFTIFITTMRREWFSIDHLRIDKFLMLVRKFLAHLFALLKARDWDSVLVTRYMDFLQSKVLLPPPSDHHKAVGLAYHIADIFVPELRNALSTDPPAVGPALSREAARQLLQPFVATLQRGGEDALLRRVREGVFEPLVDAARGDEDDEEEGQQGAGVLGAELAPTELATELFDLGAAADVKARNRTALYGVSQELERAAKKRAKREAQAAKTAGQAGKGSGVGAAGIAGTGKAAGQQAAANGHVEQGQPAAGKGKRKRGKHGEAAAAVTEPEGEEAHAAAPQAAGRKRKAANGDVQVVPQQAPGQCAKDAAKAPSKPSTHAVTAQPEQPRATRSALKSAAKPQPDAPAGPQPHPANSAKKQKATPANQKHYQGNHAHVTFENGTVPASAASTPVQPSAEPAPAPSAKKSVKINLKKNLYFAFGGPVPDAMVRTPPTARSKGGILKKTSSLSVAPAAGKRPHRLANGSQSAPPKVAGGHASKGGNNRNDHSQGAGTASGGKKAKALVTPTSVPRTRAADLFA